MFEGTGEEDVILAQEAHAVQRRAREVVCDFFAEFAGEHGVDFWVGGFGVCWLLGHRSERDRIDRLNSAGRWVLPHWYKIIRIWIV